MIKAIPTEYKGYRFRSRLEARWAVFFDACGVTWEYEPEGIILSDGTAYLPDFYLSDFHCYFEVKRKSLKGTVEGNAAESKISNGQYSNSWAGIISFGDPMDDDLYIYCQETDDGGGGCYEDPVTIGLHPDTGDPYLLAYEDRRPRAFFSTFGEGLEYIPMVTTEYGKYRYGDFVIDRVYNAREAARQVSFEHNNNKAGVIYLPKCAEMWVYGNNITYGMNVEIENAKKQGILIRYFTEDGKEVSV